MNNLPKQLGFTIIELMIATSIFSVVLLLCTTGLLQITKVYYKGITSSRTQEASRTILEDISRRIQFSGGKIVATTGSGSGFFCIGENRYSYVIGQRLVDSVPGLNESNRVLVLDTDGACSSSQNLADPASLGVESRELLSTNMRLAELTVTSDSGGSDLYNITIRVVSGADGDLVPTLDNCDGGGGNQFCAISELSTTVQKRIQ